LKERNAESSARRESETWEEALELARDSEHESKGYEDAYNRGVAATRQVFWPCSAVIALKGSVMEEVPATPRVKDAGEGGEDEEGGNAAEDEEGEDGEPRPPPMKQVEVPILRYVATSHSDSRAIEGWTLRYMEEGRTRSVVETAQPLLIHNALDETQGLHFFHGRVRGAAGGGSYCAVPLKDKGDGSVYGVLAVDSLLDNRTLTGDDVEKLVQLAACIDEAREPFASVDREKRRLEEEEKAEAARKAAEEEEAKRKEEEDAAAAAAEGDGGEGGGEGAEDKGN
jgi:hypothetical protein